MNKTLYGIILSLFMLTAACGDSAPPTKTNINVNANKPAVPTNLKTPFDDALFNVRNGDFEQVLVFTRKDAAAAMKPDDFDFLKANSPNEAGISVNRWLKADDKTVIAGTNYLFTPDNLKKLQARFQIEDFSLSNDGAELDLAKYQADYQTKQAQSAANSNTKK